MPALRSLITKLIALTALVAIDAIAQTTAGAGSVVVIPTAANISVYKTQVFIRNPGINTDPGGITVNVRYYQSVDGTPPAGLRDCGAAIPIALLGSASFDLGTKCGLTGTNDDFGMIILEDAASEKTHPFLAYSRTQTPDGIGFSVEGFPVGNFSGADADVLGLRKLSTAPFYRSNCFVASLNEPVDWQILLAQSGGVIGSLNGSLGAYQTTRILDVFAAAGLAGDFTDVRATFSATNSPAKPALIGFCTLETSSNGSADFRIAKSVDASDARQQRLACYGQDDCSASSPSIIDPAQILDATKRNIHYLILDQPDYVKCDLVSPRASELKIQLRVPGNALTSLPFPGGGGPLATSFYIYTGERSTIGSGSTTRWYIDVAARSTSAATPINYGITCRSGNGVTVPWLGTSSR